jgi:hypothetical protein
MKLTKKPPQLISIVCQILSSTYASKQIADFRAKSLSHDRRRQSSHPGRGCYMIRQLTCKEHSMGNWVINSSEAKYDGKGDTLSLSMPLAQKLMLTSRYESNLPMSSTASYLNF